MGAAYAGCNNLMRGGSTLLSAIDKENITMVQGHLDYVTKESLNKYEQMGHLSLPADTWTPLMRASSKQSGEMLSRLLVTTGIDVDGTNEVMNTCHVHYSTNLL